MLPDGFRFRLFTPEDVEAAAHLIHLSALKDQEQRVLTRDILNSRFADGEVNPEKDLWVVEDEGGALAAYGEGIWRGEGRVRVYQTRSFVHPDQRNRGIGRALVANQWRLVEETARRYPGGAIRFRLGTRLLETNLAARAVVEASGMKIARRFIVMNRDLPGKGIPEGQVADAFRIVPWVEQREDEAVWNAYNDAFSEHWGFEKESFEKFRKKVEAGLFDPRFSFILFKGDEVVGASLNDMGEGAIEKQGRNQAWVQIIFVRKEWRRRGLARALLVRTMEKAMEMGHSALGLNVDATNESGAVRVYESVGFYAEAGYLIYYRDFLP
ncbi:MAG TPA: GNAT family N-acetyltransferase [Anaerolineaceae bacterium]|nr:GNAT family N-acetyltransferase [Anaerolineaceae bacterium]HPN51143.1 GNAT family N-acetyltransferase [Anaerolineaceae bacterium]